MEINCLERDQGSGVKIGADTCFKRDGTLQPQVCMGPSLRRMCSRTCRYCSRRCSLRVQSAESLRRDATPLLGSLRGEEREREREQSAKERENQPASQPRPKEMPDTLRDVRMFDFIYIYVFGRCYLMLTEGEANRFKKEHLICLC